MRKEYTYEREIDYPAQIRVMRKQIRALEKEDSLKFRKKYINIISDV